MTLESISAAMPWLIPSLLPIALVFARTLGLAWTSPGWGTTGIGWRIRVGFAAIIALAIAPAASLATSKPLDLQSVMMLAPIELGIGALLGLGASLVLAGARQAGELIGVQTGLSPAALLDPEANEEMNALGHLYGLMALGVFLALDGPLGLVSALLESYGAIPLGGITLTPDVIDQAFGRVAWALSLALRAAAPAGVALIAAGVALGMLGRAAPSLSLLSYSLPIRVGVGLLLALIGLAAVAGVFAAAWSELGIG